MRKKDRLKKIKKLLKTKGGVNHELAILTAISAGFTPKGLAKYCVNKGLYPKGQQFWLLDLETSAGNVFKVPNNNVWGSTANGGGFRFNTIFGERGYIYKLGKFEIGAVQNGNGVLLKRDEKKIKHFPKLRSNNNRVLAFAQMIREFCDERDVEYVDDRRGQAH